MRGARGARVERVERKTEWATTVVCSHCGRTLCSARPLPADDLLAAHRASPGCRRG